jgi:hypothetical protein
MAYNKINWEDAPSTATPLDAENLNHMDDGIYSNSKALNDKLNKMPFDTEPKYNSPNYITSGTLYNSVNTLNQSIEKKANKATTLAGYGITDAYNKTYLDKALKDKLNKMPFDTVPAANSPNYVTSGTVYNSVNSLMQTVAQNKTDIEKSLAGKYDAANNEIGSGELSPTQTIYEGSAGKFVYSKNGDVVTVSVNITSMTANKNYLQMTGLPFPAKAESKLASIAVYSTANKLRNVRISGSWIYVSSTDNFAEGEKINFIITYIIR